MEETELICNKDYQECWKCSRACWLLSPCPDCKEGKRIKKIGNKITKNLKNNKIMGGEYGRKNN